MGKPLNQQRRGKGSPTFKSPKHKYAPRSTYTYMDDEGVVIELFRDSQRSAPLALIRYETGVSIIPAASGLSVGQIIQKGDEASVKRGNIVPLKHVPEGEKVFCIELRPGDGGKMVRGAGASATVMTKTDKFVKLKMPSGQLKSFLPRCKAIVGVAAGAGIKDKPILKAGKNFHIMKAKHTYWPRVSSSAMNAVEHPFGGGRKHSHVGKPQTVSRHAPPGRKVGSIAARRMGRKR
ncbi:MAG: 50S ribosomal protein L2 [Candidatus Altiarchaeota archaeon]|nr:50S ribosomal protein L2 [Candidatus Altiarchaeota archaeon]